ncbi:FkbM family methyltransferase [bacterium]|jgi:FkbM family methyltransferase|nr:FkbM family methyltransferase [bacterium]
MLLNFDYLYNKYKLKIDGVIHIGAHHGQEYDVYEKYHIENLIFFEALPHTFSILKNNIGNKNINGKKPLLVNKALGNDNKIIDMYVETANNGQSSSILKPNLHLTQYPWIQFNDICKVDMIRLNDYDFNKFDYNFINIDVQGYELEVFKGSDTILDYIDYIYTEVNFDDVYDDCVKVEELDKYLSNFGFKRVETDYTGNTWGDAFYIKENK